MSLLAAILVSALGAEPFTGINEDLVWTSPADLPRVVAALRDSRAECIRMPFRWRMAEPEPDKWDFGPFDRVVAALPQNIEVLGTLMSPPAWATGVDPAKCEGWFDAYPPKDPEIWGRFVAKVVTRYKTRVRHWEVWNEQNGVDFFRPQPDAVIYTKLLRTAYQAAKQADPTCVVVLGGLQMNGVIPNPWSPVKVSNYLESLYTAGAGPYFDVCNIHPYVLPKEGASHMMELIRGTLDVMQTHGDAPKPLWITEVGCGLNDGTTPEAQAALLSETFKLARAEPRIRRVFWFMLRDMEINLLGPEATMGLVRRDLSPRLAMTAFQAARGR